MRELSAGRLRAWPALGGVLLLGALAAAQLRGSSDALAVALGAVGLAAVTALTAPRAVAAVRRHRGLLLVAVLAALLAAWVVIGITDASRVWRPYAPPHNGAPLPPYPIFYVSIPQWPWRLGTTPLWPLVLALLCGGGGFVLVADAVRVLIGLNRPPRSRWRALTTPPGRGGQVTLRALPGVALIICGAFLGVSLLDRVTPFDPVAQLLGLLGIAALAALLIASPAAVGLSLRYDGGREHRARDRERERFAAHLHDSVLQTLALIQRQASEPDAVVKLARRQEDALRAWMAGQADLGSTTITTAVREMLTEIEDEHGVKVELTAIGDATLDARSKEMIAAAREALRNVGRHAAGTPVNVFLDIGADGAELFVRDSGPGFSFAEVPIERRGLRDSVIGRMHSVGGTATVDSSPGEGTEIALKLPQSGRRR